MVEDDWWRIEGNCVFCECWFCDAVSLSLFRNCPLMFSVALGFSSLSLVLVAVSIFVLPLCFSMFLLEELLLFFPFIALWPLISLLSLEMSPMIYGTGALPMIVLFGSIWPLGGAWCGWADARGVSSIVGSSFMNIMRWFWRICEWWKRGSENWRKRIVFMCDDCVSVWSVSDDFMMVEEKFGLWEFDDVVICGVMVIKNLCLWKWWWWNLCCVMCCEK